MSDRRLEHLFERFRAHGDVDALGQVFDATAPDLRRIARHLTRDGAEAEDLVQATFLAAIEKRATFDATRELKAWLTGILLKQASLVRRARARAIEPDRLAERSVEDPLDAAAARELSEALTIALARLSPSDRDVLIPLLLDGRRAVEIARELGARPDTVNMRIHRGIVRLRQLLPAGITLGVLAKFAGARGLSAVRAEVLRRASVQVQGVSVSTAGAVTVGIAMSMKKIAVVVALALVLGIGGYRVATSTEVELGAQSASLANDARAVANVDPRQAPDGHAGRVAVASTLEGPSTSATAEHELVFDVVREDGGVASNVPVALFSADGRFANRLTDENGRCAFQLEKLGSNAVAGHLYVRDDAAFPQRFAIELTAGRRILELSRGVELSGRIAMQGDVPLPRFELQLTADSAPSGLADADIRVFRALELLRFDVPHVVARTKPSADGAFRFRVPDAEWAGILRLPGEFVIVDGARSSRSNELVIPRPTTGLEVVVAYGSRIIGRLVDAPTRLPIADATLMCVVFWGPDNTTSMSCRTDADGRFTIPLNERTDASELRIDRISTLDGRSTRVAQSSKWKGPCDPFDAGDIECTFPASRPIEFRVHDVKGALLPGARAEIRDVGQAIANQHGIGLFAAVPLAPTQMRVVAPGHGIETVAVTEDTGSPIDVELSPTNRLTIALPREAAGRRDLQVSLVSTPHLFGGRSRMYDHGLRGGAMVGCCLFADGDDGTREGAVRFGFSDDGLLELEGIVTGVPFLVRLVADDNSGDGARVRQEVAIDSMGPVEQRRIDLELPPGGLRSLIVLRGRAADERGRPIHGASLAFEFGDDDSRARTELDGTFRFDLPGTSPIDVEVSKRGYVPFRVRDWDVTTNRVLEATLRRGRDLRVELVDDLDRAIQGARVSADVVGFGRPWRIAPGDVGLFTLCDVPVARTEIVIELARRRYVRVHDGAGDVARAVLPAHGRVEVAWTLAAGESEWTRQQLALRPIELDAPVQTIWLPSPTRPSRAVFEAALPGEYTIAVESGRGSESAPTDYRPIGEPKRITIRGGETVRVDL